MANIFADGIFKCIYFSRKAWSLNKKVHWSLFLGISLQFCFFRVCIFHACTGLWPLKRFNKNLNLKTWTTISQYLVQAVAWCRIGDKPLPEPMLTLINGVIWRHWTTRRRDSIRCHEKNGSTGCFKNAYELLNLRLVNFQRSEKLHLSTYG